MVYQEILQSIACEYKVPVWLGDQDEYEDDDKVEKM